MGGIKHTSIVDFIFLQQQNVMFRSSSNGRNCDDVNQFCHHTQRLLIKSRSKVSFEGTKKALEPRISISLDDLLAKPEKRKEKKKVAKKGKFTSEEKEKSKWVSLSADTNKKYKFHCGYDYFLMRTEHNDIYKNKTEVFCQKFAFTPKASRIFSLEYVFKEFNTETWAAHDVWYPSDAYVPAQVLKEKVVVASLIVLHKPNKQFSSNEGINLQSIDVYNFNNGRKLDVKKIKSTVKFKEVDIYHEEGMVICTSSRTSLHADVAGQFLVFRLPPLTFRCHLQVTNHKYQHLAVTIYKTAVDTNMTEIEINGNMFLMITKKTTLPYVEISNFEKVMDVAVPKKLTLPVENNFHHVTHILQKKPEVLWKIVTNEGYLGLHPYATPTVCIKKSANKKSRNNFQLATYLDHIQDPNEELTHHYDEHIGLKFFPQDGTPTPVRILHGGMESGFSIYGIENVEDGHCVKKLFPKKAPEVQTSVTETNTTEQSEGRRPRRSIAIRRYSQPMYEVHALDYNSELNLFVVGVLNLENIQLTLYDFRTMELYCYLPSVKILKQDRIKEEDCAQFTLGFHARFVIVRFNPGTQQKRNVYCLSLTDEDVY